MQLSVLFWYRRTEMENLYEMFASCHEEFFPPQSIMFVYLMNGDFCVKQRSSNAIAIIF